MKRKLVLIILVLLVSTGLIFLSKGLQKQEAPIQEARANTTDQQIQIDSSIDENKEETKNTSEGSNVSITTDSQDNKPESTSKTSNETQKTTETVKNTKPQPKAVPVQVPNLTITDSISGKAILSKTAVYNGETVAQATIKALDSAKMSYKASTFGDAVYFSSINGLRERSAGPSSGWCYYINGRKLSVGAGSYKLNKDDKLEWKFLKDGVSVN